jgi:hypothetical protein
VARVEGSVRLMLSSTVLDELRSGPERSFAKLTYLIDTKIVFKSFYKIKFRNTIATDGKIIWTLRVLNSGETIFSYPTYGLIITCKLAKVS